MFNFKSFFSNIFKCCFNKRSEPVIRIEDNKFSDGKCSVTIKGNPGISFEVLARSYGWLDIGGKSVTDGGKDEH